MHLGPHVLRNSEPTRWFSQTTPDEHPSTLPPCRWPALITLRTPKFQLVWRRLCAVPLVLPFRAHPYGRLCYPKIRLVVIYHSFVDFMTIYMCFIFSTRLVSFLFHAGALRWARLIVSPPPLSPSNSPTLLPSRWLVLTTLPLFAKFQLVLAPLV